MSSECKASGPFYFVIIVIILPFAFGKNLMHKKHHYYIQTIKYFFGPRSYSGKRNWLLFII
jgi:hypothetical protein